MVKWLCWKKLRRTKCTVPWWRSSKNTPSFECFMLKTFKTMLKINYYWTFGERLGRTKCIVAQELGGALSLTCFRGWWAHVATPIADALLSCCAVLVVLTLLHTDPFTIRKNWVETLKYHDYLCCKWPWPNNIRIHFDLGLHCFNMNPQRTSSDPFIK